MASKNNTYCSLAWTHQFIDPTGKVKPCCRFAGNKIPVENNIHIQSIEKIFHSQWMKNLRENMISGRENPGCIRCYQEERAGHKRSLRQIYNQKEIYGGDINAEEEPRLKFIELAISNDCNLKCVMCDSRYSYKWIYDEKLLYGKSKVYQKTKYNIDDIKKFASELRVIKFTGGEPLVTPDHYQLIEFLIDNNYARNISLDYSTNLTVPINSKLKSYWSKFKYVEFSVSIDGVGLVNDYIRYPSKWNTIETNIKDYLKLSQDLNVRVGLRPTISAYNISNLPELLELWKTWIDTYYYIPYNSDEWKNSWVNPTHVTFPQWQHISILPKEIQTNIQQKFFDYDASTQEFRNHLNHFSNMFNVEDYSEHWDDFIKYTKILDKSRNLNVLEIIPELEKYFT